MTISRFAPLLAFMLAGTLAVGHAQEGPSFGLPVPPLGAGPFVFDSAEPEGSKIRVSVVTKGLSHPWSIVVLPDGSMLVTERPDHSRTSIRWQRPPSTTPRTCPSL